MSDNLKRNTPDFSKYDSMSIGELEEILRADAQGPERDDSDVDEILYIMEVLVQKRKQNGIAGKTALEAYQEFQQHYLPVVEEDIDIDSVPKRKANIIQFRKIAVVAACLVLVFSFAISANAFSFENMWNAVVTWAQETFRFGTLVEFSEPKADSELKYESLKQALEADSHHISVPSYIPEGYILCDVIVDITPIQETYIAVYQQNDQKFKISVRTYIDTHPEQIEISHEYTELYYSQGYDYYLLQNNTVIQAVWIDNGYECYITGQLTTEELKMMINSIPRG